MKRLIYAALLAAGVLLRACGGGDGQFVYAQIRAVHPDACCK